MKVSLLKQALPVRSILAMLLIYTCCCHAALVESGTSMVYLPNAADPGVGLAWTTPSFDDSAWSAGTYGIGYDTAGHAQNLLSTVVSSGVQSVYTRAYFTVADVSLIGGLSLGVDYDDGYIAWINGVEVFRSPEMSTGTPVWNASPGLHESSNGPAPVYTPLQDISSSGIPALQNGTNVLAVGVWNDSAFSSDLVLVPQLVATGLPTPALLRGPYLQLGTPSSVVVRWRTDIATSSRVSYGPSPGNLFMSVDVPAAVTEHSVNLTGLTPNTTYYYTIGTSSTVLAGDDALHYFVTAPAPGMAKPTRVWVIGDSGTAGDPNHAGKAQAVANAYRTFTGNTYTDLWLMLGDNAYPNGTDSEYQVAVFDVYPDLLRQSVLWSTLGNHDGISADSATQSGPYYDIFTLPKAAEAGGVPSGTEAYYSFDYENIHFVCLDSNESDRSVNGAMLTWLQQDLAATTQQWIIAFWHHPPYTKGSHNSDVELQHIEMRQNALPILEQAGVDLVLGGHSHSYERSFLINGHYGDSATFTNAMKVDGGDGRVGGDGAYKANFTPYLPDIGSVYVVAGSSGLTSGGALNHPAMYISLNELGSLVLDIDGDRLDATFLTATGASMDYFSIIKPAGTCSSAGNPGQPDSDSDGIIDSCDTDDDNDGLPDSVEIAIGTNPLLTDTDGDKISDFDEVNYDGDPSAYTYGQDLNPLSQDTDNDGIPDDIDTLLRFTFRVAAVDSSDSDKAEADYICDGMDDQGEINAAILALPPQGGDILLAEGRYLVRILTTLHTNDSAHYSIRLLDGVRLKGAGINRTIIRVAENQTVFGNTILLDDTVNATVRDLQLDGDWESGNNPSTKGIGIREGNATLIQNVYLKNFSEHFIALAGANNVLIDRVTTTNTPGNAGPTHGVDIDERGGNSSIESYAITIQNSYLANPGHDSTKVEHATNIRYLNNVFYDRVVVNNDTSTDVLRAEDVIFLNNTFSDQAAIGYRTGLVTFDRNTFDENGYINVTRGSDTVQITNNVFNGSSDYYADPSWIVASGNKKMKNYDTRFVSAIPTGPKWNQRPPADCCVSIRYLTPETAASNIQDAIDIASPGDVIMIADGIYSGPGNINISTRGKALTIRSMNGGGTTIIDAQGAVNTNIFNIVNNETSSTAIQGLTLTGGNRDFDGGAILISGSSPLLADLSIENNAAITGGGIRITNNANPVIYNSRFIGNTASGTQPGQGWGGAISVDGNSSATIVYSVFSGNSARLGGAIRSDSNSTLVIHNSTISGNSASQGAGGIQLVDTNASIINSILWDNGSEIATAGSATASIAYSAIEGGFPGTGNTGLDPLFRAPASDDFTLLPTSPLVDAGIDLGYQTDNADNLIYDVPYVVNSGNAGLYSRTHIDIGALEYDACTDNPATGKDTDGDGLRNACDSDDDNDGLPDSVEYAIGTSPLLADTDGDGLSDYDEVAWNGVTASYTLRADLDPLSADSDGDGFSDGMEILAGYTPLNSYDYPVWGDINNDRIVDAADVLLATRATLYPGSLTVEELARCNVAPLINGKPYVLNNNGCDVADLLLIQRKAIGAVQY